jgi:hypothetical protein
MSLNGRSCSVRKFDPTALICTVPELVRPLPLESVPSRLRSASSMKIYQYRIRRGGAFFRNLPRFWFLYGNQNDIINRVSAEIAVERATPCDAELS